MSRSNNSRRRRQSNTSVLHSNDYVTRRRSLPQALSRSQLQELRDRALWDSFQVEPLDGRRQPQARRTFTTPNVNRTRIDSGEFLRHKGSLDRINSQRAANVGVDDLKKNPVLKECVRRTELREVLFASRKTGKGKRKPPVFTDRSKVRCK